MFTCSLCLLKDTPLKAILLDAASSRLILANVPDPAPRAREVRIQVHASGINRADLLQRRGLYPPPPGESDIIGLEAAGEVLEVGPEVRRFKPGERVMALLGGGGYAEQVCV